MKKLVVAAIVSACMTALPPSAGARDNHVACTLAATGNEVVLTVSDLTAGRPYEIVWSTGPWNISIASAEGTITEENAAVSGQTYTVDVFEYGNSPAGVIATCTTPVA